MESDSKVIELRKENRAKVQTKPSGEFSDIITNSSPIIFLLSSREKPSRQHVCSIDIELGNVTLLPINKDNKQFSKEIIKKPLQFPKDHKQKIQKSGHHFFQKLKQRLISYYFDFSSKEYCFLSLDLSEIESKEFRYRVICRGQSRPEGPFSMNQMLGLLSVSPYRVSTNNLCVATSDFRQKNSKGGLSKKYLGVIAEIRGSDIIPNTPSVKEGSNPDAESQSVKPLFLVAVNPEENEYYQEMKASQSFQNLNLLGTKIGNRAQKLPKPTGFYFNQFPSIKKAIHNNKLVSFVIVLQNNDIALLVYDLTNKKLLKKNYISINEILSSLNLVSRLLINEGRLLDLILNPYKNSLSFRLEVSTDEYRQSSEEHRREKERLVGLGYDISGILEKKPYTYSEPISYFVEILNCFEPKRRIVKGKSDRVLGFFQSVTPESIIRSGIKKDVEINISGLRDPIETNIMLKSQTEVALGQLVVAEEVDNNTILLCDKNKAVLVDKETSKVLYQRELNMLLDSDSSSARTYQDMMIVNNSYYFTLLKWEDPFNHQKGTCQASMSQKIHKILDFRFAFNLSPTLGKIKRIYDFRILDFDHTICSIILLLEEYLTEKGPLCHDVIFHGLFDLRKKRFINHSKAPKKDALLEFGLDFRGNPYFRSSNGLKYQFRHELVLPGNTNKKHQLLHKKASDDCLGLNTASGDGCLRLLKNSKKIIFKIRKGKKGYLGKGFFYQVEGNWGKPKRIAKYKLNNGLLQERCESKEVSKRCRVC